MIQFMKNLSMMGTMVFLIANGSGALSFDNRRLSAASKVEKEPESIRFWLTTCRSRMPFPSSI